MNESSKRILIYRLGSLGDTVVALPCFHKVRESFPNAEITLLTNRPVIAKAAPLEAVLGNEYFFDRVLDYPIGTRNPYVLFLLILKIRALNIDTVINLAAARSKKSTTRDYWFFRAAGVKRLIGFPSEREDFEVLNDPGTGEREWEAKRLARRIKGLGIIPLQSEHYWDLRLTQAEFDSANQLIYDQRADSPIIAICAGTKIDSKDWGEENWLNLIGKLRSSLPGWKLVMIGAADEAELADRCLDSWGQKGINLCGKTSPRVSAAILKKSTIFVGHDSGPMHLAACVGTPCVAIFSARVLPRQWYPRGDFNQILYHQTDCAGCELFVCIDQRKKCILSISIYEVEGAVMKVINNIKEVKIL